MTSIKKYYGHATINHPQGWSYLVLFLDENCSLSNCEMIIGWFPDGTIIKDGGK